MMSKPKCRQEIIAALEKAASASYQNAKQLAEKLFKTPYWQASQTIGITLSTPIELDTWPIIERAREQRKRVVVPKTLPNWQMTFIQLTSEVEFKQSQFGVLEPQNGQEIAKSDIELLLVPGLGFAPGGQRLGFGGGYYDRYLADYHGVTVALALPEQTFVQPVWPVKEYDVLIQHVLTVEGV